MARPQHLVLYKYFPLSYLSWKPIGLLFGKAFAGRFNHEILEVVFIESPISGKENKSIPSTFYPLDEGPFFGRDKLYAGIL